MGDSDSPAGESARAVLAVGGNRRGRAAALFGVGVVVGALVGASVGVLGWLGVGPARGLSGLVHPAGVSEYRAYCRWDGVVGWFGVPTPSEVPGKPPVLVPAEGTATMRMTTSLGVIEIRIDLARTPCTAASLRYVGGLGRFDDTSCGFLDFRSLACGDLDGELGYELPTENLPPADPVVVPQTGFRPPSPAPIRTCPTSGPVEPCVYAKEFIQDWFLYRRGLVVMAPAMGDALRTRFVIVFEDTTMASAGSPFGVVTRGMDIVDRVAAAGGDSGMTGRPQLELAVRSLRVTYP